MRIFAAGDLHLSKSGDKPMDVFGAEWRNHGERICAAWNETVKDDDIVLVPGDLSWAMRLEEAYSDLECIMQLPGEKIFIKGNHDYWWNSISKVRDRFSQFKNAHFIQNDCIIINNIAFSGTRGWLCPQSSEFSKETDEALYKRELCRLEMSLKCIVGDLPKVLLMHFPPTPACGISTGFTELAEKYNVKNVVYGHLHGYSTKNAFEGDLNGVRYTLCSVDHTKFKPIEIQLNF